MLEAVVDDAFCNTLRNSAFGIACEHAFKVKWPFFMNAWQSYNFKDIFSAKTAKIVLQNKLWCVL